jgi:hypothetical protein
MMPDITDEYDSDEYERECRDYVERSAIRHEAKWRDRGGFVSWVELEPEWLSVKHLWGMPDDGLPDPKAPCRRIFRLTLIGGGQLRVTEKFVWRRNFETGEIEHTSFGSTICYEDPKLAVIPHVEDGVVRASGLLKDTGCNEMDQSAVVLFRGGDQALADRVAATLRLIRSGANFWALLDGSLGCAVCGRALRDEVSKLLNIGPDCAKKLGRTHNLAAASEALHLRGKLLA